ncbi:sugar phosphate isomerase/epimerase family protein [Paenibacillus senegalensis]|uniref:sugar phosphate isomerase/epimerase family protein n=1 Tax=Paenibacillus senegalensis TaxID=1465766 RepID=UPI0002893317|nr:sugar phosphate isomerase/epimerase family protein [Paenibacillus senegalensis]
MLKGLTRAGLGDIGNIEQWIEAASRHHFQAIDPDAGELVEWVSAKGAEKAAAFLEQNNIRIGSISLSVQWRESEEQFISGLPALSQQAAVASSLGCRSCGTYILPSTDRDPVRFMAQATRRLRIIAQILAPYGIKLALEFVGPHHLRTKWKHPFLWEMDATLEWIQAINEPNVGLLLDSYHWYTNGLSEADIRSLSAEQIAHVHINDAPDVPIAEVLDNDRVYPGEGVIDLPAFLKAVKQTGYQGAVSQEILTPEPPKATSEELLKRSEAAFSKVFGEAGL